MIKSSANIWLPCLCVPERGTGEMGMFTTKRNDCVSPVAGIFRREVTEMFEVYVCVHKYARLLSVSPPAVLPIVVPSLVEFQCQFA